MGELIMESIPKHKQRERENLNAQIEAFMRSGKTISIHDVTENKSGVQVEGYTITHVMQHCGVSRHRVERDIEKGLLETVGTPVGGRRVSKAEMERYRKSIAKTGG